MTPVYQKNFPEPSVNRREILRYAGYPAGDADGLRLADECLAELAGKLRYAVVWRGADAGELDVVSADLSKNLRGCGRVVLFAATVGLEMDRKIARYSRLSPTKALMMQAVGAERIEALCDVFCGGLGETRPRFSPGYGDLDLAYQRTLFALLDCPRTIGLTLTESLLMSPTKSVTAIVGLQNPIKTEVTS